MKVLNDFKTRGVNDIPTFPQEQLFKNHPRPFPPCQPLGNARIRSYLRPQANAAKASASDFSPLTK
jgi:hypothetical protein